MSAHQTSDDAKRFRKKQIANHAFVKENRHISSRSASLQFRFMRRLTLRRQTKSSEACIGSWRLCYLEGNIWLPQSWRLQCFLTDREPDFSPCHPNQEQNHHTTSELPASQWCKKLRVWSFDKSPNWRTVDLKLREVLRSPHTWDSSVCSKYFTHPYPSPDWNI